MTFTYEDVKELTKATPESVRFYRKPKPDLKATKEKGYPVFNDVIYCEVKRELEGFVVDKKAMLSAELPEDKQDPLFLERCEDIKYPTEWRMFQSGDSEQIVGFRLDAFFVNEPSKAEYYKHFGVYTVEQLSSLPESSLINLGHEARADKRLAEAFLKKSQDSAGARMAQQELETLQKKLEQAADREEMLLERLSKLESLVQTRHDGGSVPEEEKPTKRRGRPKKVETGDI